MVWWEDAYLQDYREGMNFSVVLCSLHDRERSQKLLPHPRDRQTDRHSPAVTTNSTKYVINIEIRIFTSN